MATLKNTTIDGNIDIPAGNNSTRPQSPQEGELRFNTVTETLEDYNSEGWSGAVSANVTGSVSTQDIDGYRIHTFTGSGTFNVVESGEVEYLIVAGGGGGAGIIAGGGGAGGVLQGTTRVLPQSYAVTVGGGGLGGLGWDNDPQYGSKGSNSSFGDLVAFGGGGGGGHRSGQTTADTFNGGSGGGQGRYDGDAFTGGGQGFPGQGHHGGKGSGDTGGGGGGAAEPGRQAFGAIHTEWDGKGGDGISSTITGDQQYYGGGGGSGSRSSEPHAGRGGLGGGGNGTRTTSKAEDGQANTGGGGGGAGYDTSSTSRLGGTGGSGIVVIRYKI